jgi:RimJ/RimL family protein N-acetyltransferase
MQNQWKYTLKNGKPVVVRQAISEDTSAYLVYIDRVFQDDRFFGTTYEESKQWQTPEKIQERITKHQDPHHGFILIAVADDKMVGLADIARGEKLRTRHIGGIGISILSEYRGLGLGTVMMRSLIEWASNDAVLEKLTLGVYSDNPAAMQLYKKMNFQEEGRQSRQMKSADGSYKDLILMYRFVK